MRMRARENNKVIRGAFQIGARKGRGSRKTPRRFKMWATTRATLPEMGRGGEGKRGEFLPFYEPLYTLLPHRKNFNICQFSRASGRGKEPGLRDNHIKAPPSGSTFAFASVSLHAAPKKERKRTPTKQPSRPPPPPPHLESTAAPEIIKGRPTVKSRSPFASGLNAKTRASCF